MVREHCLRRCLVPTLREEQAGLPGCLGTGTNPGLRRKTGRHGRKRNPTALGRCCCCCRCSCSCCSCCRRGGGSSLSFDLRRSDRWRRRNTSGRHGTSGRRRRKSTRAETQSGGQSWHDRRAAHCLTCRLRCLGCCCCSCLASRRCCLLGCCAFRLALGLHLWRHGSTLASFANRHTSWRLTKKREEGCCRSRRGHS